MRAFSNGGFRDSKTVGTFPGMFNVWYNPDSMLNMLVFSDVRKHFRVTMDTSIENTIKVHMKEGHVLDFEDVKLGLYLLDNYNVHNKKVSAYFFKL